jgi:cyclic pyranopterin phosphate synthase
MVDPFGRAVTYLRVSVTDRCDFRCTYCMAEHMTFLPKKDLLTLEELNRLCSAFKRAGLKIKLNAVALKGFNEAEIPELLRFAHGRGMDITVIETMPMGEIDEDRTDQYLPLSQLRADLEQQFTLSDIPYKTGGPARYVKVEETGGRLGFITPMTHNFCESCNRVRLTCTGTLYMCLGQNDAADLRTALRATEDDALLYAAIDEAITRKPKGHDFIIDRTHNRPAVARHMSVTGG